MGQWLRYSLSRCPVLSLQGAQQNPRLAWLALGHIIQRTTQVLRDQSSLTVLTVRWAEDVLTPLGSQVMHRRITKQLLLGGKCQPHTNPAFLSCFSAKGRLCNHEDLMKQPQFIDMSPIRQKMMSFFTDESSSLQSEPPLPRSQSNAQSACRLCCFYLQDFL